MNKSELIQYINNSDKLNDETLAGLQKLVEDYPYFQTAHLLLAKNRYLTSRDEFERNLPKAAVLCADRSRFFYLINNEKYGRFFPKEKSSTNADRTQDLLDNYLENFSAEPEETQSVETHVVSTDYLAYLQSVENADDVEVNESGRNAFRHQSIIDDFLQKANANEITFTPLISEPTKYQETDSKPGNEGFLTETLAKIYIKQKKYEQALTIIKQLSLNFPKKSVYFADQIRFLELLILNEKNKKQ